VQAAPRSELLAEAIPEATKNMVLMLLNKVSRQEHAAHAAQILQAT